MDDSKETKNEEDMLVKSKQSWCSIIGLIHNIFVFSIVFLCYSFAFGVQRGNVKLSLAHPKLFRSLKKSLKLKKIRDLEIKGHFKKETSYLILTCFAFFNVAPLLLELKGIM